MKLLLVDGRDQWVINGREVRLLLCEIWVEVVDVLWRFNPRLERWLNFSTIQLLPVDAGEEGVAGHRALSAL